MYPNDPKKLGMTDPDELVTAIQAARLMGFTRAEKIQPLIEEGILKKRYTPLSGRAKFRRGDVLALITDQPPQESMIQPNFNQEAASA